MNAAAQQPSTAATSSPSVDSRRGSPHEKLSSNAIRRGRHRLRRRCGRLRRRRRTPCLGVVQAVPRVDADADGDAVRVGRVGEHHTVGGTVGSGTDERADHGGAEDLVVVAVDRARPSRRCSDATAATSSVATGSSDGSTGGLAALGVGHAAFIRRCGRPSCRNAVSSSATMSSPLRTISTPSPVKVPTVGPADTGLVAPFRRCRARHVAARRRPCAPALRSATPPTARARGTCVGPEPRSTSAPTPSAISPIADDNPPAPQSVMPEYMSSAPTSTSISSFSTIGSPICTLAPATSPVVASIVADEKVAPRMPSRPVAPPSTTIRSPACGPSWTAEWSRRCRCTRRTRAGWSCTPGRRGSRRRRSAARSCCRSRRLRR